MLASEKLQSIGAPLQRLIVRLTSFSFHRGLPVDDSGNGGGFVFDARSIPNPGREEQYKKLTGRDEAVVAYLNGEESLHQFFSSARSLVDLSVSAYLKRGFQHLMVSFGCTGGQHRSVFLAEQMARHLRAQAGVEVILHHREQEFWPR